MYMVVRLELIICFFLELLMPEIFLKFCRSFENDVVNNLNEYKKCCAAVRRFVDIV